MIKKELVASVKREGVAWKVYRVPEFCEFWITETAYGKTERVARYDRLSACLNWISARVL